MKVALLGATGLIGSAVLHQAIASGHEVRALVRTTGSLVPVPGCSVVLGDARDLRAVTEVVAGSDVVISAIGPRANTPDAVALLELAARNVVTAMQATGVSRLVFVAGAGIALAGERRTILQRVAGFVVRRLAKWVVLSKEREMEIYLGSGLVVHPRLLDGDGLGCQLAPRIGLRCRSDRLDRRHRVVPAHLLPHGWSAWRTEALWGSLALSSPVRTASTRSVSRRRIFLSRGYCSDE